jgi:hypothetical protein
MEVLGMYDMQLMRVGKGAFDDLASFVSFLIYSIFVFLLL